MAASPSRRRPTMVDVAARAGVSRALVSIVFRDSPGASPATRARVLAAAAELGYRPDNAARLLARGRSRTIGVLTTVGEPFEADIIETLHAEAAALGYDVLLGARTAVTGDIAAAESLLAHRCEGLVLLGPSGGDDLVQGLGARAAVAVVGRDVPGVDSVSSADAEGLRAAVEHLISLGHGRIVHVDGGDGPNAEVRRSGFRAAMGAAGLEARVLPGAYHEDAGVAAARQLLAEGLPGPGAPTAVLAANDRCALGLLDTLRRAGIDVPAQLSVVGYNDDRVSRLSHVDLTTVRQDASSLARKAIRAVTARLDAPDGDPVHEVLAPQLVVRGTTGPAPR
ncbi:LacI family DNA-binding transcriptional regulator [Pseudonocardia ailaonensis]|uniref:LacI family DNA-binding transcriptional regulator n=1 Tax=Pseudonocardia ailaonensis TaxID=367279 RepID=A0ABN2NF87_9PSEU